MKKYFLILFLLWPVSIALAKKYHVDCHNSSKGKGTLADPFQTIAQAAKVMVKGDVCLIHQGIYREIIQPRHSGTSRKPIVFKAFKGDTVIISAAEQLSEWIPHSGNVYKKTGVNMPLGQANNVYFQGKKMQLARWPNDSDQDEYSLDGKYIDTKKGSYSMSFISNQEIPNVDWTGGTIHYLGAHSGCSWQRGITDFEGEFHRIHFETLPDRWPFGKTHSPKRYENGHRGMFYLMNKLEALDAPGEWFYDARQETLYFYAPEGMDPNEELVEVANRTHTAKIYANYIHLEGLNFFGGILTIRGNHNKVSHCMVKHGSERLIKDLKGAFLSDAALQIVDGHHNLVEKCVLENGTLNGIYIGKEASDNRVENCIVQHFNTIGIHASLLHCTGPRNRILKSSFYGSARDGIKVSGKDSEFAYNHVQKCLISGADGGLFYVTGKSQPINVEIHHNWFHDAYGAEHAGKKATGIYLDNNSAGYIVHHNVVWDVEWGALHFNWNALENEIYNNTFWNVGGADEAAIDSWVPKRNDIRTNVRDNALHNNLCDLRPWWHSGDGKRYRVDEKEYLGNEADNLFDHNEQFEVKPFWGNEKQFFMPYEGSPAIDAGRAIKGITDGYKGAAPDLGAYEYGGTYWIPGVDWIAKGFAWSVGRQYQTATVSFGKQGNRESQPIVFRLLRE